MSDPKPQSMDGNAAAAHSAYLLSDVGVLYPITPSTPMCQHFDEWSQAGRKNLFGNVPEATELQAEGGVAGTLHGAAVTGNLTSTFTCAQGLLLMIPNMYKVAHEMLPVVFHVSSRLIAYHAMSIYNDHSDIYACRDCGFAMLCANSPQECMDMSSIAHCAMSKTMIPFMHFFDGLRTSHVIQKVVPVRDSTLRTMFDYENIQKWRNERSMNPEHPTMRGCVQNNDIFWGTTELTRPKFEAIPDVVEGLLRQYNELEGREYHVVEYVGPATAKHVVVIMASGASTMEETLRYLLSQGETEVGLLKIRLFRPFPTKYFIDALPATVERVCVMDRTQQATAIGEPLYLEILAALQQNERTRAIRVIGGRYGVGGYEFNSMTARAIFDNLKATAPRHRFNAGITDDLHNTSLPIGPKFTAVPEGTVQCLFYGMGADGTVGSSKNAITLIGDNTDLNVQGHFVFDAKKTGGYTFCHLRFGPQPIQSEYEIYESDYTACHQANYVHQFDIGSTIKPESTFVLNSPWETLDALEANLPGSLKRILAERKVRFYNINAAALAQSLGLGSRINMIMQTCFFRLANVLPFEQAVELLKSSIVRMYSKKGPEIVQQNIDSVDRTLDLLCPVEIPAAWAQAAVEELPQTGDDYIDQILVPCNRAAGARIPVSHLQQIETGLVPTGTTKHEKRGVATHVPRWDMTKCTECNICSFVCPHAAIRPYVVCDEDNAPATFTGKPLLGRGPDGQPLKDKFTFRIQVSPDDCLGCNLCATECPVKALTMVPRAEIRDTEAANWDFAETLPRRGAELFPKDNVKGCQFQRPLLEFNGACAGCSEPTYFKVITQLLGPHLYIANAVGCSMVWGGYTPVNPYPRDIEGIGPAWACSLFEDNAEFGYGISKGYRMQRDTLIRSAQTLCDNGHSSASLVTDELRGALQTWLSAHDDYDASRANGSAVKAILRGLPVKTQRLAMDDPMRFLIDHMDLLIKKYVWVLGGDGWAYDIDFHGVDHVLHSEEDVNILVFDTEVYSNTGGQCSKATPRNAAAKLAVGGKPNKKKELGYYAMNLGTCYVGQCSIGMNKVQFLRTIREAVAFKGPSLILCYCPCIAHGLKRGMGSSQQQQKLAVQSGYWPLFRFNPRAPAATNPLTVDATGDPAKVRDFVGNELRFSQMLQKDPAEAEALLGNLTEDVRQKGEYLRRMVNVFAPQAE